MNIGKLDVTLFFKKKFGVYQIIIYICIVKLLKTEQYEKDFISINDDGIGGSQWPDTNEIKGVEIY